MTAQQPTLETWMSALTLAGYDLINVRGHTSRGGNENNRNHPMQHTNYHYHREGSDVILCHYCVNGRRWTTYAVRCIGKRRCLLYGFEVRGNKQVEIERPDEL